MDIFFRNQVNIFTFLILSFVLIIACRKLEKNDSLNRAFIRTVIGVMIGLAFESISVFANRNSSSFSIMVNNISSVIIFALAPMISFSFFIFIFRFILPEKKFDHSLWTIILLPIALNIILAILSPFYGFFFSIGSDGIYVRGPLFLLSAFSTYLFMIAGNILILFNMKRIIRIDFWLILGVGIVPILGGIIQSLFYGVLAMWSSAGVALFLVYLFLQDRMIHLDSLTGAWNRESFYYTYTRRIQLNPEKPFGAIYFDIDNLKMINDNYGHLEGDNAIKLVMKIVRQVIPPGGIICRLGGDEFIVLINSNSIQQLNSLLNDIKDVFNETNVKQVKPYPLHCSFGSAIYTSKYTSLNAFLSKLDQLMYLEKFSKRAS